MECLLANVSLEDNEDNSPQELVSPLKLEEQSPTENEEENNENA